MGLAGHMAAELGSIFRGLVEAFPPNHLHDAMGGSLPAWILPADARVELRIGGRPWDGPDWPLLARPRMWVAVGSDHRDRPLMVPGRRRCPAQCHPIRARSVRLPRSRPAASGPSPARMRGILNGSLGHLLSCTYGRIARPSRLDVDVQVAGSRILSGAARMDTTGGNVPRLVRLPPSASTRSGPPSPPTPVARRPPRPLR